MASQQTNPYELMGMLGMMQPNPYTAYEGALPMPGFRGTPTDATGKPIQSYLDAQTAHDQWAAANPAQGTTLNTPQQNYGQPGTNPWATLQAAGANPQQMAAAMAQMSPTIPGTGGFSGVRGGGEVPPQANPNYAAMMGRSMAGAGPATSAASAATKANSVDMRQAYLDALSNPGKVTTPGATVPASNPLGTPSVMSAFLAANPGGGSTSGSYSNKPFFNTLNQLRSA